MWSNLLIYNVVTFVGIEGLEPTRLRHLILSQAWLPLTAYPVTIFYIVQRDKDSNLSANFSMRAYSQRFTLSATKVSKPFR